jgi:pullulanase
MYEAFGAVVTDHTVEFRLFFPDVAKDPAQYENGGLPRIKDIRVTGTFQGRLGSTPWNLQQAPALTPHDHPNGILYTGAINALPDGFYEYKYFVTFENGTSRWCTDPCTRYVGTEFENAGFVIGGNDTAVVPIAQRLPLSNLVIYELMVDDFTADYRAGRAPFDAVRDRLDDLQSLGVNAIEFMPWTAWRGGAFSWGYDPFLFFAVENRYIEDPTEPLDRLYRLQRLVNELHARNIHVIMDGVFNHVSAGVTPDTGFPYHWLYQDPAESPFTGGFAGGGYFEDLDYNNGCTEQFIRDVCQFWLDAYQLDGIRFDYTLGFYQPGTLSKGIPKLVADLKTHLATQGRQNVALILEHLTDNRYAAIDATNTIDASACWYDRFLFDVPDAAGSQHPGGPIMRVLDTSRDFAPSKGPVVYIENHDHSTVVNRLGGRSRWWKMQAPLIALLTCPGAVMLHNGQEFGDDQWLPDGGSGRVQPRPLSWDLSTDDVGRWLRTLHGQLIQLRHDHPALQSPQFYPADYDERDVQFNAQGYGVHQGLGVVIYHRWGNGLDGHLERFIVVVNFSDADRWIDIPFSTNGTWVDVLNDESVQVQGWRLGGTKVPSNWGKVFWQRE